MSSSELNTLFWILFIAMIVIAIFAGLVQSKFQRVNLKNKSILNKSGKTGKEVAEAILSKNNITNVKVVIGQEGQDQFDPRNKIISLSPSIYNSASISAMAIAAHEAGHAVQWKKQNVLISIREAMIVPVTITTNIASIIFSMSFFLLLIGGIGSWIVWTTIAGLFLYLAMGLFQLITLPIEFDASKKAIKQLKELNLLANNEEIKNSKEVLNAAAMTYVVAFAMTLVTLLMFIIRFLLIFGNRD